MITIKATKAGVEFLNDTENSVKVLAQKLGDETSESFVKSAAKVLSLTDNGSKEVETKSIKEANFLIVNKLAEIVETPHDNTNHLASVHKTVGNNQGEIKTEEYKTDALAKVHAGVKSETPDEQLGDTPEETPTHLGGIKLESEEETN